MAPSELHPWLVFDEGTAQDVITRFLSEYLERAGADGYVIGLSGGLDSSAAARLAVDAVGAQHVSALSLPGPTSSEESEALAQRVAAMLEVNLERIPIEDALDSLVEGLLGEPTREALGNMQARLRMTLLYANAQARDRLVLGTGNKTELLTGYFTKHGDGGVDVLPLGDLYKTQARALAGQAGLPDEVLERPPTAGLWEGQTDEDELGITYEVLDVILSGIEQQHPTETIGQEAGVEEREVQRVRRMVDKTQHKRNPPPVPKVGWRTVGVDWREPTLP